MLVYFDYHYLPNQNWYSAFEIVIQLHLISFQLMLMLQMSQTRNPWFPTDLKVCCPFIFLDNGFCLWYCYLSLWTLPGHVFWSKSCLHPTNVIVGSPSAFSCIKSFHLLLTETNVFFHNIENNYYTITAL